MCDYFFLPWKTADAIAMLAPKRTSDFRYMVDGVKKEK